MARYARSRCYGLVCLSSCTCPHVSCSETRVSFTHITTPCPRSRLRNAASRLPVRCGAHSPLWTPRYTEAVIGRVLAAPGMPAARVVFAHETEQSHGRCISVGTVVCARGSSGTRGRDTHVGQPGVAPRPHPCPHTCPPAHLRMRCLNCHCAPCQLHPIYSLQAHVAGMAHYDSVLKRSLHARIGPWIAYRAATLPLLAVFSVWATLHLSASSFHPSTHLPPRGAPCSRAARVSAVHG